MLTVSKTQLLKKKTIPGDNGKVKLSPEVEVELQELKKDLKLPEYCNESEIIKQAC